MAVCRQSCLLSHYLIWRWIYDIYLALAVVGRVKVQDVVKRRDVKKFVGDLNNIATDDTRDVSIRIPWHPK
jgi:hypothetical protein